MSRRDPYDIRDGMPEWVRQLTDEFFQNDVEHALGMRHIYVQRGAKRTAKDRELLRRGDAILARVEKRPTQKNAVDLVSEAEDLYRSTCARVDLGVTWPEWLRAVDAGELRDALVQMVLARDSLVKFGSEKPLKRIDKLAEKLARRIESGNRTAE